MPSNDNREKVVKVAHFELRNDQDIKAMQRELEALGYEVKKTNASIPGRIQEHLTSNVELSGNIFGSG